MSTSTTCKYTLTDGNGTSNEATITVEVTPRAPTNIFLNPFNKMSIHHRPLGAGRQKGLPAGYNYSTKALVVPAVPNSRGRLSVVGRYWPNTGGDFYKHVYSNDVSIPGQIVTITTASGGNGLGLPITLRMPNPSASVYYPKNSNHDSTVSIYDAYDTGMWIQFYGFEWATKKAKSVRTWPADGLDYPGSDSYPRGTSASALRWPSTVLRADEFTNAHPTTAPIRHALNVAVTRLAPAGAQILSPYVTWPAFSRDGSGAQNVGDIHYGTLLFIDGSARATLLSSSPALSQRQRALVDAHYYYGVYVVDGTGYVTVGGVAKGVMRLRTSYGMSTPVIDELKDVLMRIHPYLWPMANPRGYGSETEIWSDGLPYRGGGGPIDANSVNSAYDA